MRNNFIFTGLVQKEIQQVEDLMRSPGDADPPELTAALEMVIAAGGKRIRPTVSLLVGRLLGAPTQQLINMAAAIELLHNATLVHDDLIDGALLRRGSPTLNSKWSSGATVLTGDLLFARAAKLAADTNSVPAIKLFALTLTRIVGGEMDQLLNSGKLISRAEYFKRIYAKTGSLFETAACTAAMISPADPEVIDRMAKYGRETGTAFQIIDDILDFSGDQEIVGKPIGSDLRQGLVTLPALLYFESHPQDRITRLIKNGKSLSDEDLEKLIVIIQNSKAIGEAYQEARQCIQKGLEMLKSFKESPEREALQELAMYIGDRHY